LSKLERIYQILHLRIHIACIPKPMDQTKALPSSQPTKCSSLLDQQFQEGQWQNQLNTSQPTNSLFLSPCNKLNRL
jgi:hypothetical protein